MMKLALAQEQNIPRIMALIDQAKAFLKANGVDQWQDGYPDRPCIEKDIEDKIGYLCLLGGKIVGYLCIDFCGERAYDSINGRWISDQPYVVVHRLALDNSVKGRGLTSCVLELVEDMARKRDVHSFKMDTDQDNDIMKHVLQKNGFSYCGTICFDNSEKIAYEKLI